MLQFSSLTSIMDAGDHFKNGASPKSLTSRRNFLRKAIICTVMTSVMCLSANHLAAQTSATEHTKWYAGISTGASVCDNDETIPNMIGLQGAYFFNQKYGVGLVARRCKTSFDASSVIPDFFGSDDHFFWGASFFAHWGRSNAKLFFPTRIGLGFDKCTSFFALTQRTITETLIGAHASAGIAYRASELISFGVNAEWASSFADMDLPELFGINIGVSFHF